MVATLTVGRCWLLQAVTCRKASGHQLSCGIYSVFSFEQHSAQHTHAHIRRQESGTSFFLRSYLDVQVFAFELTLTNSLEQYMAAHRARADPTE
jgi:hypothetical protein